MYDSWRLVIVSIVSEIIALERLHYDNDFLVSFFALQRLRSRRLVWGVGNGRDFIGWLIVVYYCFESKASQLLRLRLVCIAIISTLQSACPMDQIFKLNEFGLEKVY